MPGVRRGDEGLPPQVGPQLGSRGRGRPSHDIDHKRTVSGALHHLHDGHRHTALPLLCCSGNRADHRHHRLSGDAGRHVVAYRTDTRTPRRGYPEARCRDRETQPDRWRQPPSRPGHIDPCSGVLRSDGWILKPGTKATLAPCAAPYAPLRTPGLSILGRQTKVGPSDDGGHVRDAGTDSQPSSARLLWL